MISIPDFVVANTELNAVTKLIYGVITREIANSTSGSCRISHDTLAGMVGVGRATAKAAMDQLYAAGFIDRSKDSKGWLAYTLRA